MNSFRLIAVRVFPECSGNIRRVLSPYDTFFFCDDYEDIFDKDGNWEIIKRRSQDCKGIPSDFFSLPSDDHHKRAQHPNINITAVVGKNGDGKSSIVEVILRILNNFAVCYGFKQNQESLSMVQDLYAALYYEIDGVLQYIYCAGDEVEASFAKATDDKSQLKKHQDLLFYTVVANYSIYAYNSRIFAREVDELDPVWIDGVFHKNDSYQTPLVLNPMRTEGNFDINREKDLCRQRLMALYTDLADDKDARIINGNKVASGFAFNLEESSKLEKVTIKRYFQKTWLSTVLKPIAEDLNRYMENKEALKDEKYLESVRNSLYGQTYFWEKYPAKLWSKYSWLFTLAQQIQDEIAKENQTVNLAESDLNHYLSSAKEALGFITNKESKQSILKSIRKLEGLVGNITGMQFQRLVVIIDVCELWSQHHWFKPSSFSSAIEAYNLTSNKGASHKTHALLYIIYKTISIIEQYPRFYNLIDINQPYFFLFERVFQDYSEYFTRLPECFDLLFTDKGKNQIKKSYDTLKLRQTLNYLLYNTFSTSGNDDGFTDRDFGYSYYVTFERLKKYQSTAKKNVTDETIALLPPPIFVGEILVREGEDRAGNPRFRLSDLSSGELQMLNSVSTCIYHLRNLNYRTGGG